MDIALLPEFRGRGTGTRLLRELLTEGRESGRSVSIHVERGNPTRRLYERLGLRAVGEHGIYVLWHADPPPGPRARRRRVPDRDAWPREIRACDGSGRHGARIPAPRVVGAAGWRDGRGGARHAPARRGRRPPAPRRPRRCLPAGADRCRGRGAQRHSPVPAPALGSFELFVSSVDAVVGAVQRYEVVVAAPVGVRRPNRPGPGRRRTTRVRRRLR